MNDYARLARLAKRQDELEGHLERAEQIVKVLKFRLRWIKETVIPEVVDGLDWDPEAMRLDPMNDDTVLVNLPKCVVKVENTFHPKLHSRGTPERDAEMEWLEQNGADSLLALDITLSYVRGEGAKARKMLALIAKAEPDRQIQKDKTIHYQTLAKFCRDMVAAGKHLPDLLGVFHRRVSTIMNLRDAPRPEPMVSDAYAPLKKGVPY